MFKYCLSLLLALGMTAIIGGCGEEEEATPTEKFGEDIQSVRLMLFRDGTVTRKLAEFRMNNGKYPTTDQGLNALIKRPKGIDPGGWGGPYFDSPDAFTDKWGNQLRYRHPSKTFPDKSDQYDLWSIGPDGADGTDDDILNHDYR